VLTIAPNAFVMVAVGNLWAHKGHGDLIEACALASEQLPEQWLLLIAGRDQEGNRAAYERLIADHGLTDNVRLLGETKDIPTLLAAADLFVQPSRHEGLPNAIVEAMAASLPVVATAVGGIPEVVVALAVGGMPEVVTAASQHTDQPAATGWLVPPHDPEALSAALLEASRNPSLRKAMGARARARAEAEFSLDRSVRDYEAIYREVTR
jgi:glycosyltransferase involved in cell wall biosynthesis